MAGKAKERYRNRAGALYFSDDRIHYVGFAAIKRRLVKADGNPEFVFLHQASRMHPGCKLIPVCERLTASVSRIVVCEIQAGLRRWDRQACYAGQLQRKLHQGQLVLLAAVLPISQCGFIPYRTLPGEVLQWLHAGSYRNHCTVCGDLIDQIDVVGLIKSVQHRLIHHIQY